jgi:hypothetical protein
MRASERVESERIKKKKTFGALDLARRIDKDE